MFDFFEKMREMPLRKRRLVAFGIALLCTGFLFVIWLSVWLPGFLYTQDVVNKNNTQFDTPKDDFVQNISSMWSGITSDVSELKNAVSSTTLSGAVQYQATSTSVASSTNTY